MKKIDYFIEKVGTIYSKLVNFEVIESLKLLVALYKLDDIKNKIKFQNYEIFDAITEIPLNDVDGFVVDTDNEMVYAFGINLIIIDSVKKQIVKQIPGIPLSRILKIVIYKDRVYFHDSQNIRAFSRISGDFEILFSVNGVETFDTLLPSA